MVLIEDRLLRIDVFGANKNLVRILLAFHSGLQEAVSILLLTSKVSSRLILNGMMIWFKPF